MDNFLENIDFISSNYFIINVEGEINQNLSDILGGLSISHYTNNNINKTISHLEGKIIDQAELIGILNTLYNMRFKILSVKIKEKTTV